MTFTTKYPNFIFLVPFADTISTEPSPESLQCHLEYGLKKVIRPKIKIPLVKQSNPNNAGDSKAFLI